MFVLDDVQGGFASVCAEDVDFAPLQGEAQTNGLDDIGLVLDDEDSHHASSAGPAGETTGVNVLPWRKRPGRRWSRNMPGGWPWLSVSQGRPLSEPHTRVLRTNMEALEHVFLILCGDAAPIVC